MVLIGMRTANDEAPADHLVRQIDGLLDLSWVHRELAPWHHYLRCTTMPNVIGPPHAIA